MTHDFSKSHYISQFATFFIDVGAKTSPATGCISINHNDQMSLYKLRGTLPFITWRSTKDWLCCYTTTIYELDYKTRFAIQQRECVCLWEITITITIIELSSIKHTRTQTPIQHDKGPTTTNDMSNTPHTQVVNLRVSFRMALVRSCL